MKRFAILTEAAENLKVRIDPDMVLSIENPGTIPEVHWLVALSFAGDEAQAARDLAKKIKAIVRMNDKAGTHYEVLETPEEVVEILKAA